MPPAACPGATQSVVTPAGPRTPHWTVGRGVGRGAWGVPVGPRQAYPSGGSIPAWADRWICMWFQTALRVHVRAVRGGPSTFIDANRLADEELRHSVADGWTPPDASRCPHSRQLDSCLGPSDQTVFANSIPVSDTFAILTT